MDVPEDLVATAIRVAGERGADVADVPIAAIAAAAGVSRSTLLRRLGGTRRPLDEAVRAAGVDPGGRPVRDRAIDAAAALIAERGLAALTLDEIATRARCSLPSLHLAFDGRDGLLAAVFERHVPLVDVEAVTAEPRGGVEETVRAIYRAIVDGFGRQPRVFPAILADVLARPDGPGRRVWARLAVPRLVGSIGVWLTAEIRAGRIRPIPLPVLVQLLVGPLATHMLVRPTLATVFGPDLPSVERAVDEFTDAFLRAVTT